MNEGGSYCLQARPGAWIAHGKDPIRLTAQEKSPRIELRAESHHSIGGDPWYGIGSKSWTDELRLTFDPKALTLASLEIDRSNTTLGFGSRTRKSGLCAETPASDLLPALSAKLRETLFQGLAGRDDSRGGALDAQFLLTKNGALLQILPGSGPEPTLEVIHLAKGTREQTTPERLAGLRIVRVKTLIDSLERDPSPLSEAALPEKPLTLNCLHPDAQEVRGFTLIRLERSRVAPGSDLGYRPLARATLIRSGASPGGKPASLPFDSSTASVVRAGNGSTLFIAPGTNGARTSSIHYLSADEAKQRLGIPSAVIAFENTVCLFPR
jgi:hypothetical protein